MLQQGTFNLKIIASYGLSSEFLKSEAIDLERNVAEIVQGDVILINDLDGDPRIVNRFFPPRKFLPTMRSSR